MGWTPATARRWLKRVARSHDDKAGLPLTAPYPKGMKPLKYHCPKCEIEVEV